MPIFLATTIVNMLAFQKAFLFHRIVDTLEPLLDRSGLPQIPHFDSEFPSSITVGQTIHTWKHIAEFQEKLLKETQ